MPELLQQIFSSTWSIVLIVFFLGGSVFVHELGHFLAARRRGLHVDRFSIGFGPKIVSWTRDGVEYRISWLPLGGYVALPQLADMRGIEGETNADVAALPPISYTSKMLVSVMGAVFNLLFAFVLACVVWKVGVPGDERDFTTTIGFVSDTLTLPNGDSVPSPASQAGLQEGDRIVAINGGTVENWNSLRHTIATSSGRDEDGDPRIVVTVERDGRMLDLEVFPRLVGSDRFRTIGVGPAEEVVIRSTIEHSPARLAGLQPGDYIIAAGGEAVNSAADLTDIITKHAERDLTLTLIRDGESIETTLRPAMVAYTRDGKTAPSIGIEVVRNMVLDHPTPWKQLQTNFLLIKRMLSGLLSPNSDIGIGHLSGPPGIVRALWATSQIDIRLVLWFVVLININFAVFNLLPIPVLDGGHMLFATISKLRGRALPTNFIATVQGAFMILLLSLMLFVSVKDIGRWNRDAIEVDEFRTQYISPVFEAPDTD